MSFLTIKYIQECDPRGNAILCLQLKACGIRPYGAQLNIPVSGDLVRFSETFSSAERGTVLMKIHKLNL